MKIAVTTEPGEVYVWAMLDDEDYNREPADRTESFIIGMGSTPREALADARLALEAALGDVAVLEHDDATVRS